VLNPEALKPLANVSAWLKLAQPARKAVAESRSSLSETEFLLALTERNVIEQLGNLRTHPAVAARLEQGNLKLHGWVYDIARGSVTTYSSRGKRFIRIRSVKSQKSRARNDRTAAANNQSSGL
jgi:carbonic anhydrase